MSEKKDARLSDDMTSKHQRHHWPHEPRPPSSLNIKLKLRWDEAYRESVTLKVFSTEPYTFDNHPCRQLVEYEIKSMDRVSSHANIVRLHDVRVISPSKFYLVMEAAVASRGDLMETITAAPEGRLSQIAARFYLGQLLDAVQHCHARGVCHRDIQPQHLLVDARSGNMKLSSFGRAGLWDTTTGDSTDLAYAREAPRLARAAPEVLKGSKYCGRAADCWSVGVVLYTMLAGFSPFKSDEAKVGICDRCFQPPPWVPPLARSLLGGIMEPDHEKRVTLAEVRSHPWFVRKRDLDEGDPDSSSSCKSSINNTKTSSSCSSEIGSSRSWSDSSSGGDGSSTTSSSESGG
eukprot:g15969.t1